MAKYIKNTSGSTGTWVGQQIASTAYYLLQSHEEFQWANNSAVISSVGAGDITVAKDDSGTTDITDVSAAINYLKDDTAPKDIDGAPLSRTKITKTGWHYQCNAIEWTTSKLSSVYNANSAETDIGYTTVKYYNSSDVELVAGTQAELDTDCVKTVITWEPTQDVEILGGTLHQAAAPTENVRLWVLAIPDLTVAQGGSIPFCQGGINLRYLGIGTVYDVDGKTPRLLPYSATYHTSKFNITLRHPAGHQHSSMMVFKLFRENV